MSTYYAVQSLPNTNARQAVQNVRPISTSLLTIDSEDRYADYIQSRAEPTSPYNFTIKKNESLMNGFFTRVGVTEVNMPWTIPNINLKTSSIQVIYSPTGDPSAVFINTINLLTGYYTPYQLAQAMQTAVRSISNDLIDFQMSYGGGPLPQSAGTNDSGVQPFFQYWVGPVPDLEIAFYPVFYNTSTYPYPPQTKQLFDVLGFTSQNTILSNQSDGAYTLCQAIRYVDIVCNQLTQVASLKDQTSQTVARDMLCRIYLGDGGGTGQSTIQADASGIFCPPGCAPMTIHRLFPVPKFIQWIPNQPIPGYLQFTVYDDAGDVLDTSLSSIVIGNPQFRGPPFTSQSTDWSMTLLAME